MSWSVHLGLPRASDALSPKQPLAEGVFMSILQMQTLRLREPRVHSFISKYESASRAPGPQKTVRGPNKRAVAFVNLTVQQEPRRRGNSDLFSQFY